MQNGYFIITVSRRGSSSMGRRLRGAINMQTRNGTDVWDVILEHGTIALLLTRL
jgi:hypothetical protein